MRFNEYQKLAGRTANANTDYKESLANYGMGLSGEAGEVVDQLKKIVFHGHEMSKEKLRDELGDVLWYLANIGSTIEIDLEDIATENIEKLKKRYPEGFSQEKSINRD